MFLLERVLLHHDGALSEEVGVNRDPVLLGDHRHLDCKPSGAGEGSERALPNHSSPAAAEASTAAQTAAVAESTETLSANTVFSCSTSFYWQFCSFGLLSFGRKPFADDLPVKSIVPLW